MDGVDRISELPEPILHRILSLLPVKQIGQTSILSKTWKRAWCTFPVFEFDNTIFKRKLYYFSGDTLLSREERFKEAQRRREKLFNSLEQTMQNRYCRERISMKKFKINIFLFDDPLLASFLERCIFYAVGSNVKELSLEFVCGRGRRYNLPQIVLFAKSVELLKLKGCKLELPRNNIQLSSLRKLYLSHVLVDDLLIENLISGCPMIEDLNFSFCNGHQNLKLYDLSRLNEIKVTNNDELQNLNIEGFNIHSLAIFWLSPSCEISVTNCINIKNLDLKSVSTKDEWLNCLISRLPLLEGLSICDCFQLRSADISSPCLRKLLFSGCEELVELKIDTPNLQCFTYSGDMISMSLNALALSELEVELPQKHDDTQWLVKYIELLSKIHYCSQVNLRSTREKNMIVPRKLRQELPSPLSSVKHLNLRVEVPAFPYEISKFLDGLLWISPHTKTVSIEFANCNNSFFKFQFSYKKQLIYEGKFASCCYSSPILCWQHCIEEVNLEISSENCEKGKNIKMYTLKGADILKKIDTLCEGVAHSYNLLDLSYFT
ncbi:hypothetical protein ACOSP7_014076 [Xanthoceras sorbifolium]